MSYILHTVFAGPMGPVPIDYLINTPQGGFYLPPPATPPPPVVMIPGVGVPDVPGVSQGVPEPGTWLLVGATLGALLLGCVAAMISRRRGRR